LLSSKYGTQVHFKPGMTMHMIEWKSRHSAFEERLPVYCECLHGAARKLSLSNCDE
jgi:hypothetical protein